MQLIPDHELCRVYGYIRYIAGYITLTHRPLRGLFVNPDKAYMYIHNYIRVDITLISPS
jgi:hypothetical protein